MAINRWRVIARLIPMGPAGQGKVHFRQIAASALAFAEG
jgi:hypothetical protein